METLSHKFLEALAPPRDQLYALALAQAGTPAGAESALQKATRDIFARTAAEEFLDIPAAMERGLAAAPRGIPSPVPPDQPPDGPPGSGVAASVTTPDDGNFMPADVWARLAATVQIEAARSASVGALHPDSQLLQPDPMLAPRKARARAPKPDFDVGSPRRVLALVGLALGVGVAVTLYILTRPPGTPAKLPSSGFSGTTTPASVPATSPTTVPAGASGTH